MKFHSIAIVFLLCVRGVAGEPPIEQGNPTTQPPSTEGTPQAPEIGCDLILALSSISRQAWLLRDGPRRSGEVSVYYRLPPRLFQQLQLTGAKLGRSDSDIVQRALALFIELAHQFPELYRDNRPIADFPDFKDTAAVGAFMLNVLREGSQFPELLGKEGEDELVNYSVRIPFSLKRQLDQQAARLRITQGYLTLVTIGMYNRLRQKATQLPTGIAEKLEDAKSTEDELGQGNLLIRFPASVRSWIQEQAKQRRVSQTRFVAEALRFSLPLLTEAETQPAGE